MYNTTQLYKDKVEKLPQKYIMNLDCIIDDGADTVTLETEDNETLTTEDGEILEFPEVAPIEILPSDIFEAGYSENIFINAFSVGTAVKPSMWVRIFNKNDKFKNELLSTGEFKPSFTLLDEDENAIETVPIGVFYANKIITQDTDIRIELFDKMAYTEKLFTPQGIECSLWSIASDIALDVSSILETTVDDIEILSYTVNDSIFSGYSQKQVLECIAQVCGSFVRFNRYGNLVFEWFTETDIELRGDWAKKPLELNGNTFYLNDNSVQITGVKIVFEDTELAGAFYNDDCVLVISENPITEFYPREIASYVLERLASTKYIPCRWERIGGDPSLQVGDILTVIDNREEYNSDNYSNYDKYPLYLTSISWTYNSGGFSDTYIASGNTDDLNTDKGMTASKKAAQLAKKIKETEKSIRTDLENEIIKATLAITGNKGGYVILHDSDEDGYPDEILVMDSADKDTAKNVWRWNKAGLGHSSQGYNGPFSLAMTAAGSINADFITTGSLSANLITTGLLQSKNGKTSFDLDSGILKTVGDFGSIVLYEGNIAIYNESNIIMETQQYADSGGLNFEFIGKNSLNQILTIGYKETEDSTTSTEVISIEYNGDVVTPGNFYSKGVLVSSTEKIKENIAEVSDVLDLFRNSKIYNYNYIKSGSSKKSHGFVIERETPEQVISTDGKHVDVYSMSSIIWKGVQELLSRIDNLEEKIKGA